MPYLNFAIVNYVIVKKNDEKDKKSFQMKKRITTETNMEDN